VSEARSLDSGAVAPLADSLQIVQRALEVRQAATPEALLFNYVVNNGRPKESSIPSMMRLLKAAIDLGYASWPIELRALFHDKDVLHFGSGQTLYGVVFRALGARSYIGVDDQIQIARKKYRNRVLKQTIDVGLSLADAARLFPGITFLKSESITLRESFDLVLLLSVTQKLKDAEAIFAQLHRSLRPGGQIWFLHENFYAWSGHQGDPKTPATYDPNNPEHAAMVDWGHVRFDPPEDHRFRTSLNRIKPMELRRIVDTYFEVDQWKLIPERSSVPPRLTSAVRRKLRGFTDIDLLTRQIVCKATKRQL
jgi:SAM-dependent methyltransferase